MTGTNYQKLLKVFTPELDELSIVIRDIKNAYQIDLARGSALDKIGVLLNFRRSFGESDEVYRERLREIIYINTIVGTRTAIQELLANYLRIEQHNVKIIEDIPNFIIVQLPPECQVYEADIERIVMKSVAAGVKVSLEFSGTYWDQSLWDEAGTKWC